MGILKIQKDKHFYMLGLEGPSNSVAREGLKPTTLACRKKNKGNHVLAEKTSTAVAPPVKHWGERK